MRSYIKGLLIGLFSLWLLAMITLLISDGPAKGSIFGVVLTKALVGQFQKATGGKGLFIVGFLVVSGWVWSYTRPKETRHQIASQNPGVKQTEDGEPRGDSIH